MQFGLKPCGLSEKSKISSTLFTKIGGNPVFFRKNLTSSLMCETNLLCVFHCFTLKKTPAKLQETRNFKLKKLPFLVIANSKGTLNFP